MEISSLLFTKSTEKFKTKQVKAKGSAKNQVTSLLPFRPNQSLKLTEPAVDDFAARKKIVTRKGAMPPRG